MKVFLYPVVTIEADSAADAIDMLMEAIFTARVGEIPGWCSPPPSFGEKRLQRAAPELLAALEHVLSAAYEMTGPRSMAFQEADAETRAAIAKARG